MTEQAPDLHSDSKPRSAYVDLPVDAEPPFDVFVSGVPQKRGVDFVVEGKRLKFARELEQEGKLGFWRWLVMFLGIAGSYGKNDVIDVTYNKGTQRVIKTGLKLLPTEPDKPAS